VAQANLEVTSLHDEKRRARSVSRHHHHSPRHSNKRAGNNSSPSPVRRHKRSGVDELRGEMNKIKPPTFDGEHKKDEDAETWLLGMRKYFQLHNYSSHAEGRISIYQLKGKASMWWDQLVQVQHIKEKSVTWREFKKYFEKKYLTKRYYDKKMKEFFELKLGSMTIDEYERRFLELLKYVSFIKDETVKIQRYLSGLPSFISDKIQYDDPKTLEETIRQLNAYMISRKQGQLSKRLGKTKRNSRWIRGRRDLSHHSSEIIHRDNKLLENPERLTQGVKGQGNHLFNVGVVKEIIGSEIVLTEVKKEGLFTMYNKLKQWRTWAEMCQGSMQPWITSKQSISPT
jgi:hypothetical protein